MKKIIGLTVSVILSVLLILFFVSCSVVDTEGAWGDALYTEDTELGSGAKTVKVEVIVGDKSVTLTLNTDADTLGEALFEHGLIGGDEGEFGLYVKVVNGITADYDADKSYWGFYKNGEYMMTGVDGTAISGGESYELVYSK